MTKEEALELIERMPYIRTLMIADSRYRLHLFQKALASEDPVEWIRLIKTDYIRQNEKNIKQRPTPKEIEIAAAAKRKLHDLLSPALALEQSSIDAFIGEYLAKTL